MMAGNTTSMQIIHVHTADKTVWIAHMAACHVNVCLISVNGNGSTIVSNT